MALTKLALILLICGSSLSAWCEGIEYRFSNNAKLEYDFENPFEGPTKNLRKDILLFRDEHGIKFWTFQGVISGFTLNHFDSERNTSLRAPNTSREGRVIKWAAYNRPLEIKVDLHSNLIPVCENYNDHKFLVSSVGEIIPVQVENMPSWKFIDLEWSQKRIKTSEGIAYRILTGSIISREKNERNYVESVVVVRESDWTYHYVYVANSAMGQLLYDKGVSLYLNGSEMRFNIEDFEEKGLAPLGFKIDDFKPTPMSDAVKGIVQHTSKRFVPERALLLKESGPTLMMTSDFKPSPAVIATPEEQEKIRIFLADPHGRMKHYAEIADDMIKNELLKRLSPQLENELAGAITSDLLDLPNSRALVLTLQPEGEKNIERFLFQFFNSVIDWKTTNQKESFNFRSSSYAGNPLMLEKFRESYQNLILNGFASIPSYPEDFRGPDYTLALRLVRMSHVLGPVSEPLMAIFLNYLKPSRADKRPEKIQLELEVKILIATKDYDRAMARSALLSDKISLLQIQEIASAFDNGIPSDYNVLLIASESAIKRSLRNSSEDPEPTLKFLHRIEELIPAHRVEYGRFSTEYLKYMHALAALSCEKKLGAEHSLKKTGT